MLIGFLNAGSFTDIDTYVACALSFFFRGGVIIRANTTSRSVPGFFPGSNAILSLPLTFFGGRVSGLPPNLRFFGPMGSFVCAVFDPLIFLLPFSPVSALWVVLVIAEFSPFCERVPLVCYVRVGLECFNSSVRHCRFVLLIPT